MRKILITLAILFTLLGPWQKANATHNRAGEITLTQLDDFTYEILITTFTYTQSLADRGSLEVQWGDNTYSVATRVSKIQLPNYYQKNVYVTQHSFPGSGTYEIVVQDPNRNMGVLNIPNSVNVVFSIKTTISINPIIGLNSTPILLNPPIDQAALNQIFIHNPAAYDPDGDSLSYKLTVCTEEDGKEIENYKLPSHSDTIFIDPITGDLTWIKPDVVGIYNIAIDIEEWRQGVKIGNIVRDMQIEVYETDNQAPEINSIINYCVEAGTDIAFRVIANDSDLDNINLSATGGPFISETNSAAFTLDELSTIPGHTEGEFLWQTDCSNVRQQFYTAVFKAEDDNDEVKLVDIENVNIKIIGSAPTGLTLIPASNSITLNWTEDPCTFVTGYNIYRKEGPSGYTPDSCVSGVPGYTEYRLIQEQKGRNNSIFVDDDSGQGLTQGVEYCYMITSIYPDGAESFPSDESCTPLIAGVPSLIQTSVNKISNNGDIEIKWIKPKQLDTIPANGPYRYEIYRYSNMFGSGDPDLIMTKNTSDISDTSYIDQTVNTEEFPYSYTVILYNEEPGNNLLITDTSFLEVASSTYLKLTPDDNKIRIEVQKNVPWINYDYTYYRYNSTNDSYDSIGFSTSPTFTDTDLKNGENYCYKVKSRGWRYVDDILYENENLSHINCAVPEDLSPPCTPTLSGYSNCDEFFNQLYWQFHSDSCLEDVEGYKLYYSPTENGSPELIEDFEGNKLDTSYIDLKIQESLTGCYYISAVDSFANESPLSIKFCLDECSNYKLPNVFSPNNDQQNDLYIPYRTAYVEKVDFQVYDRWGILIFQTEDPDLNWDGKIMNTDKLVSPGVYYYICEVFEPKLGGLESYALTGFIYVYSGKENEVFIEK